MTPTEDWLPRRIPAAPLIREFQPSDEPAVLELFDASGDWFHAATGAPSGPADVQSLFYASPEGADLDAKRLLVADVDGRVAAVVDVVLGWPTASAAAVGLFLVHPDLRRNGIGGSLARTLLDDARRHGISRVTTTVPPGQVGGRALLAALGFTERPHQPGRSAGNRTRWAGESDLVAASWDDPLPPTR